MPIEGQLLRTLQCYRDMIQRCYNPKAKQFKNYGGRGIRVCDRWRTLSGVFIQDMGLKPDGMSIERKNVNGNYEPDNCKWASNEEQQNNRRDCFFLEVGGRRLTLTQWSWEVGVSRQCIKHRILIGWPTEYLFKQPGFKLAVKTEVKL